MCPVLSSRWGAERKEKLMRGQTIEDIGQAVVLLASEDGRNITGQTLNVDGGRHKN